MGCLFFFYELADITLFIHSLVSPKTGPWSFRANSSHALQSSASCFNFQYPLFSSRSLSSCLCLLSRLPVTSILPCIFPSIARGRRQFVRKMWPMQLTFLNFIVYRIFLSFFYPSLHWHQNFRSLTGAYLPVSLILLRCWKKRPGRMAINEIAKSGYELWVGRGS